jgi:Fe-Mn family superoxide dismutase
MPHQLPPLPYPKEALEPHISRETLEYHHGKHHKAYVDKLNELIKGGEFENAALEDIVRRAEGKIFNNAAQHWNHSFFWNCLTPKSTGAPSGALMQAIDKSFGSFDEFKKKFGTAAEELFGTGWAWLVKRSDGSLAVEPLEDACNPLKTGTRALLTLDVWEHAYYIDYRNRRPDFVKAFWSVVNWDFASRNYAALA